jgi:hypothetical protein
MKLKIIFILLSVLLTKMITAQDCFIVMKIKGTITLENSGVQLKANDQICSDDKIIFGSREAVAILYSTSKGRYTIKPDKSSEKEISGVIESYVSSVLSKSQAKTDTRAYNEDIKKAFGDTFYVIDKNEIYVNTDDYPLGKDGYFYITYNYNSEKQIKKLKSETGSFIIDKESVYNIDGKEIDETNVKEVTLYYSNISDTKVKTFCLRFLDSKTISEELTPYISELRASGKNDEEIIEQAILYFIDVYGNIDIYNFRIWLNSNFNLGE